MTAPKASVDEPTPSTPRDYDCIMPHINLSIAELLDGYRSGRTTPGKVMETLLELDRADSRHVWIARLSRDQVMEYVSALDPSAIDRLPLFGVPFVIKDNIDLAGIPTTAGCPDYAYTPTESATVVRKLIAAGAIPLGKANLDQFATGLVGVRSPYGACRNSFNPDYVSGGSSSGSAVAVATGLASFALGTDTAGSGRVPAAFNNLVGLKPSLGRLSTRGVVPACRSLDCVSIFALTAEDAAAVLTAAEGYDAADAYSRKAGNQAFTGFRVGVPRPAQLEFFGDTDYERLFGVAVERLASLGCTAVEIDLAPFLDAARLLYDGPWIAARYAAVGAFLEAHPGALHPVTREIIAAGARPTAAAAFSGQYQLRELARASEATWSQVDVILTPTAGTIYTVLGVESDPLRLNGNLGFYTNFMNLLDLAGVAAPAGFRADGLPFGVTFVGPRDADRALLQLAARWQRASVPTLGALDYAVPAAPGPAEPAPPAEALRDGYVAMAVCGAHMDGLPLNPQLRDRDGYFVAAARTAAHYRLFALPGGPPQRPGLIRVSEDGQAVDLEIWALPSHHVGSFIAGIPAPLGIGKIELDSGALVTGFICEGYAMEGASDISSYGGWREYLKAASNSGGA
jgi:allophanate hydrolase